jgi:hypothetical protein
MTIIAITRSQQILVILKDIKIRQLTTWGHAFVLEYEPLAYTQFFGLYLKKFIFATVQ